MVYLYPVNFLHAGKTYRIFGNDALLRNKKRMFRALPPFKKIFTGCLLARRIFTCPLSSFLSRFNTMPDPTSPDRVQLIQNAILFLNDPKTQNSSLTSRVQFLESKGLTEKEIEQAIREAGDGYGSSAGSGKRGAVGEGDAEGERTGPSSVYERPPERPRVPAPNYGYGYTYAPPEPPKRDWRDLFVSLYTLC